MASAWLCQVASAGASAWPSDSTPALKGTAELRSDSTLPLRLAASLIEGVCPVVTYGASDATLPATLVVSRLQRLLRGLRLAVCAPPGLTLNPTCFSIAAGRA